MHDVCRLHQLTKRGDGANYPNDGTSRQVQRTMGDSITHHPASEVTGARGGHSYVPARSPTALCQVVDDDRSASTGGLSDMHDPHCKSALPSPLVGVSQDKSPLLTKPLRPGASGLARNHGLHSTAVRGKSGPS